MGIVCEEFVLIAKKNKQTTIQENNTLILDEPQVLQVHVIIE